MDELFKEKEKIVKKLEEINYKIYQELNNGKDYNDVYNGELFKQRELLNDKLDLIERELFIKKTPIISDEIIELKKLDDDIIGDYFIYLKSIKKSIGLIKYRGYHNEGSADIGYIIDEKYRNKGYAKRALDLLSEHLFNNDIYDFWISCYKTNIPSVKIITSYGGNIIKEENDILLFDCTTKKRNIEESIKRK